MSDIAWSASLPQPRRMLLRLRSHTLAHVSPLTGQAQTVGLPGARWEATLDFPLLSDLAASELLGLRARLRGRANRLLVHNLARPAPLGVNAQVVGAQNLLKQSNGFDQSSAWAQNAPLYAFTPGSIAAPDGTMTGYKFTQLQQGTNSTGRTSFQQVDVGVGDWTFSIYAKALNNVGPSSRGVALLLVNAANTINVRFSFNLATLVGGTPTFSGAGEITPRSAVLTDVGNGWYRCAMRFTVNTPLTAMRATVYYGAYAGTLGNELDLYLWQAQLEQQSAETPVIPTTTAAVTRPANAHVFGASQTGASVITRGWEASRTGLLLPGDFIGVGGELKMVTARVDSDLTGQATIAFEPPLRASPANESAIVTDKPAARFMLADDAAEWVYQPAMLVDGQAMELLEAFT